MTSAILSSPLPFGRRIEGEGPYTARIFRARFKILLSPFHDHPPLLLDRSPFPRGKGLGVRFRTHRATLCSLNLSVVRSLCHPERSRGTPDLSRRTTPRPRLGHAEPSSSESFQFPLLSETPQIRLIILASRLGDERFSLTPADFLCYHYGMDQDAPNSPARPKSSDARFRRKLILTERNYRW
jgi:hypothetical protein